MFLVPNPSILRAGLLGFEANLLEHLGLPVKLGLASWEFVDAQHKSQNVGVLLSRQTSGCALRHGFANAIKQIAQSQSIPIRLECAAGQCRSGFPSREHVAMTGSAFLAIDC